MATLTASPRVRKVGSVKKDRGVRFIPNPDGQGDRIIIRVTVRNREVLSECWINPTRPDFGEAAFQLEKVTTDGTGELYSVLIDGPEDERSTCDCKDFLNRSWKKGPCKHILACRALLNAGKVKPMTGHGIPRVDDLAETDEQ